MVTKPTKPDEPGRLDDELAAIEGALRTGISGSPVGAVRRIVLYVIVAAMLAVGTPAAAIVGLVALILLVSTDSFR